MKGFTTSRDRIVKATGENSAIDWQSLTPEVAQYLLDKIGSGKTAEDIAVPAETHVSQPNTITIFGKTYTLQETLQATCLLLQVLSLITTIVIACKIRK